MKRSVSMKLISLILVVVITVLAIPLNAFATTAENNEKASLYLKELRIAQAETREEAKISLEDEGFIFLDYNLNEGTDEDGIWLGYKTTTDPTEAIYDIKLMNMNGGFTLTSVEEAIKAQETTFAEMAADLELLIKEFVGAYKKKLVSAEKAYKALNFFRLVEGEDASLEENGLGYQLVHDGMTTEMITEMIMFCDPVLIDSIVKILAMGIQLGNDNWIEKLSELGPYDDDYVYGKNEDGTIRLTEAELKRRAEQLATVVKLYADAYNAFDELGLMSGKLDENFNLQDAQYRTPENLSPEELSAKKADESRYKIYKVVYDELATYSYGTGQTLKDFFSDEVKAKELYPLVSVLSDGEFAAMSYGCFLDVALGANAKAEDFDNYDDAYNEITKEVDSVYLYMGVDKALLSDDAVVGFTDEATRHMAATGEMEFFENTTLGEEAMHKGKTVATYLGATGLAVIAVSRIVWGAALITGSIIGLATGVKSAICAGIVKICSMIGGPYTLLITAAVVALTMLVSWLISVIDEAINGMIDWSENPMPEYIYDVKDVVFKQTSENEGIATDYIKQPVFGFYEAVRDEDGEVVDLNARSLDASQWIGLYVSYDALGDDAKPIEADSFKVQYGNGVTPVDYKPLTRFGEIIAYDLNQWDGENDVNGIYVFYKQDETAPPVDKGETYYIKDLYLQSGESPAHCIALLEAAGYTPLNVNLSPDCVENGIFSDKVTYTYLGYKTTTEKEHAYRDMRLIYGPNQGEIKLGNATYAECGSNGWVTLYATKYVGSGSPILAGGIQCVSNRDEAPVGYEPVNFFAGGPAVSFSYEINELKGVEFSDTQELFLYFLPEQSFADGPEYLGGLTFFNVNNLQWAYLKVHINKYGRKNSVDNLYDYLKERKGEQSEVVEDILMDYMIYRSGYHTHTKIVDDDPFNTVALYYTHNPYRAVYDIKATGTTDTPEYFNFDNLGYVLWNRVHLYSVPRSLLYCPFFIDYNEMYEDNSIALTGKFYVSGNPLGDNLYDETTGQMTKRQPLSASDVVCSSMANSIKHSDIQNTDLKALTDVFNDEQIVQIVNDEELGHWYTPPDYYIRNSFIFYVAKNTEERPYVSKITAIDELSIYRASGGHDAGMKREYITDSMLYRQLAAQGATTFCNFRPSLNHEGVGGRYTEMNALRFGYARTSTKSSALTDVFIYVNDFSFDEPPKYMYRNNIQYTLICDIPYNLTGYEGAPGPGVWLYGTTDTAAGARIIDFEVSGSPFMTGYETIRTQNGRSPWAELRDMMEKNQNSHFLDWAVDLFEDLKNFFFITDKNEDWWNNYFAHTPYYFHVKREGESIAAQKPYVKELYVTDYTGHKPAGLDELFDMGADEFIDVDLNQGAGGQFVLVGYSRTASTNDAIKNIYAYHGENPPATLTDGNGDKYKLVNSIDLNIDAGGDYIYLYTTKDGSRPIFELDVGFERRSLAKTYTDTMANGKEARVLDYVTRKWGTNYYSDLNAGTTTGPNIYLFYRQVSTGAEDGSYKYPISLPDTTYTREGVDESIIDPNGKYIAALYLMDKETLNKELGYPICYTVSEAEIFARLREMGATEIIKNPISVNSRDFDIWNDNKVYIGYSRTNDAGEAIKDIAIHVELISHVEPKESITINKRGYKLVAEPATDAKELPKAINLLGIGDGHQVAFPKMYLYTTTAGTNPPITDICIDRSPLIQGWNTVRSSNGLDAYVDVMEQAHEQYLLADKDDLDSSDSELIYTDPLFEWMDDVSEIFDPAEENVTSYYIHTKNYEGSSVSAAKPYVEKVFVAAGDSRHDALSQLVAFAPDEFIDFDLNKDAGGKYVYVAYKRTAKKSDAVRDLMICEGSNPDNTRRVEVNSVRIKYELVAPVDLNAGAGGSYLYLYATYSGRVGNPIKSIHVVEDDIPTRYLQCGNERSRAMLVERDKKTNVDKFTDECIDLNEGCGFWSAYIYMYMMRESEEGHWLFSHTQTVEHKDPTCKKDGYHTVINTCYLCNQVIEKKTVLEKTGLHVDKDGDKDHKCDICNKRNVTSCVRGEPTEADVIAPYMDENGNPVDGSYTLEYRCTECKALLSSEEDIVIPATPENIAKYAEQTPASIFGEGSILALCIFAAVGILAALLIPIVIKKKEKKETKEKVEQ